MVVKGQNRDTAWYSILDCEWPARKAAFERWLAPENFDAQGRQKASLSLAQRRVTLRRAGPGDLAVVTALQRAAYAKNRPLLGVEPLPLLADYDEILRRVRSLSRENATARLMACSSSSRGLTIS